MSAQHPNYETLPEHMRHSMQDYIENGVPVGSFLRLIIANNFKDAAGHADYINQQSLFNYCYFLVNEMPPSSQGSEENYNSWIARGGLKGSANDSTRTT